eukprot:TRINITY_DN1985_c0_g1_i1.p1 TRINITY_DN1985_c0_g1~~TRINITY_DN1985_c0_g1_i1.p1  ORF type:complete len:4225 (-),score=1474.45 TRINITY_DN1985_c0_g1_i1:598-13272(-)
MCPLLPTIAITTTTASLSLSLSLSLFLPLSLTLLSPSPVLPSLDSFLERVHDVLDLMQTIVQFNKLEKIEIGGTKGRSLSTSVRQVFTDFQAALVHFHQIQYDIMDASVKQFDDDFYEFRSTIKELERRVGSVLNQGLDDCATVNAGFKLRDSFEGLLDRDIIQSNLEKKHMAMLKAFSDDLKQVQDIFLTRKDDPPMTNNMPKLSGSIFWCRGLIERIEGPMGKFKTLNKSILETEEAKDTFKTYQTITQSLKEHEENLYKAWVAESDSKAPEKLKQSLLTRDEETRLLKVNFDPALVRLLREVKYLIQLDLKVPESAMAIYKRAENFRTQIGNLELIVHKYNNMLTTMLDVERPLFVQHLKDIDSSLEKGIGSLNWKSHGVGPFITQAMAAVNKASNVLLTLKSGVVEIQKILERWSDNRLIDRKDTKTYNPDEFSEQHKALTVLRHADITEGANEMHELLHKSNRACQVSKGAPAWKGYLEYVNDIVTAGLCKVVTESLQYMDNQVNPEYLSGHDIAPLLELKLELVAPDVQFVPDLDESGGRLGVQDLMNEWIFNFFQIGSLFRRIDLQEGNYIDSLRENEEIKELISQINSHIDANEDACRGERDSFTDYNHLWTKDITSSFNQFIEDMAAEEERIAEEEAEKAANPEDPAEDEEEEEPETASERMLRAFDDRISEYRGIQERIQQLPNSKSIGWLKIDAKPLKQALSTWCSKWTFVYTHHLASKVSSSLNELDSFIAIVNHGLSRDVQADDIESLMQVMGHIRDTRNRETATDDMFEPLRDTVHLLRKHDASVPEDSVKKLEQLPILWSDLKKLCQSTKEKLNNLQNQQVDRIRDSCTDFARKVKQTRAEFKEMAPFQYHQDIPKAYNTLNKTHTMLHTVEEEALALNDLQELFELQVTEFEELKESRQELKWLKTLWDTNAIVVSFFNRWRSVSWDDFECDTWHQITSGFMKQVLALNSSMRPWNAYQGMAEAIREMRSTLPLVHQLTNPAMRERHWKQLMRVTSSHINLDQKLSLGDMLALRLSQHTEDVLAIVERAVQELAIERTLAKIEEVWSGLSLEFTEFSGRQNVMVLKPIDTIMEELDDNQLQLQKIRVGKHFANFADEVNKWHSALDTTEQVITIWYDVQLSWSELVNLFTGSADIRKQLPDDVARFDIANEDWKSIMEAAQKEKNVIKACSKRDLYDNLKRIREHLERCEKALGGFLENKCKAFPRFYLVSSSDLMEILSKGYDCQFVAHKYISKMFDGVADLVWEDPADEDQPSKTAIGMVSGNGEAVKFAKPVYCSGASESWLSGVLEGIKSTMRGLVGDGVSTYVDRSREEWVFDFPSQVVQVASQIHWTSDVDGEFQRLANGTENALKDQHRKQQEQLERLTTVVQGDMTDSNRVKLASLLTLDVHARDVVSKLIDDRVDSASCFDWQSQLRYMWEEEDRLASIHIADSIFPYGYEYVGNTRRLVITPLTDRCYLTLTQALTLKLGGAPAGPAGTGKTETTKDLGHSLGLPVFVFNCSEQMDYRTLSAILKGMACAGPWICFDEFNRLQLEVLSVVSSQFQTILEALRVGNDSFRFEGDTLSLASTGGCFATMNPGYAGRQELPESAKVLFRPVSMVVPDLDQICEIMLFSEGFSEAKQLAVKFVGLYRHCKMLLSRASHYDWGLRAVKAVLTLAGSLKRDDPDTAEAEILKRALRDFNLPKIIAEDVLTFEGLVQDLFPLIDAPPSHDQEVERAVRQACHEMLYQPEETFRLNVVQLHELLLVRHSVFILGPAGSGKTATWKTLKHAHGILGKETVIEPINPKAITPDELYGSLHPTTREWKDGLFSMTMREFASSYKEGEQQWILMDGDIDPIWIESLNSVMDDNKMLTLSSNERIALTDSMRLLFEAPDLVNATPATVSRAGVLYINDSDLGWNPYVQSWISNTLMHEDARDTLAMLFHRYIPETLSFMKKKSEFCAVKRSELTQVTTVCSIMEGLLADLEAHREMLQKKRDEAMAGEDDVDEIGEQVAFDKVACENLFVFACIWGLGAIFTQNANSDARDSFSHFWKKSFSHFNTERVPEDSSVFDFRYNIETGELVPWTSSLQDSQATESHLIDTVETVRISYMLNLFLRMKQPICLVGPGGTGKTSIVNRVLAELGDDIMASRIPLTGVSTSTSLQRLMELPLEKKAGRIYGPPGSKHSLYFIDDLNMPMRDEYGTRSTSAHIRHHLDHGTFIDRSKCVPLEIKDVSYLACFNPEAGHGPVSSRLLRHFAVVNVPWHDPESLESILKSLLGSHLMYFEPSVQSAVEPLAQATMDLHKNVSRFFVPTATKLHYIFNLRDITQVINGILIAKPDLYPTTFSIARLWIHECWRVWGDRMATEADRNRFGDLVLDTSRKYFPGENSDEMHARPMLYTTFMNTSGHDTEVIYQSVKDYDQLQKFLLDKLTQYNESHPAMDLVLFEDAMDHICRIARILQSVGNALLIGVGGSGKQSLARLASYVCALDTFQVTASSTYNLTNFKEDLKNMFLRAGTKAQGTVFLISEQQIVDDSFLVPINDLLYGGDIPELFSEDEVSEINSAVRIAVKQAGLLDSKENCWSYFIDEVRHNLHVVLCLSPAHEHYSARIKSFPALITSTGIDYFQSWPDSALVSVATQFLHDVDLGDDDMRENIIYHMAFVHQSVTKACDDYLLDERRYNYTTPKSYLELISLYKKLLAEKRSEHDNLSKRLESGVEKMKEAKNAVDDMTVMLAKESQLVEEKKTAAEALLTQVGQDQSIAEEQRQLSEREEVKLAEATAEVEVFQAECQRDLEEAEPALERAAEALKGLNKSNLTELKSFSKPPSIVVDVTSAVLIILSPPKGVTTERSWAAAKKTMAQVDRFLSTLQNFDKDNIPPANIAALEPYLTNPEFNGESLKSKSSAAAGLCNWVVNIVRYHNIYQKVAPKRAKLAEANAKLAQYKANLQSMRDKVADLEGRLKLLTDSFEAATSDKNRVIADQERLRERIKLSERLLNGLASENERWQNQLEDMNNRKPMLLGDVLLASAFISYIGAFNRTFRDRLVRETWRPDLEMRAIPITEDANSLDILVHEALVAQWNNEGLPADRLSVENGAIMMTCERWPLLIDPQQQGLTWLKNSSLIRTPPPPPAVPTSQTPGPQRNKTPAPEKKEGGSDGEKDPEEGNKSDSQDGGEEAKDNTTAPPTRAASSISRRDSTMPSPRPGARTQLARHQQQDDVPPLQITQTYSPTYMQVIESALLAGTAVIVEDVSEDLDPVLAPILSRQTYKRGRNTYIKFNDREIEYQPTFQLFLQTHHANPHFKPEIVAQTTVVNFTVTAEGLEDQMLALVVNKERPDLEQQRTDLLSQERDFKIKLKELEDSLLTALSTAQGDILDNNELIENLETTKKTSSEVEENLQQTRATEHSLNETRELYRPVATRGSLFYFLLREFENLNHMYQYSLDSIMAVFQRALAKATADEDQQLRVINLVTSVTNQVFGHVSGGLFSHDKLTFSFQLCLKILEAEGEIVQEEFEFLVHGAREFGDDNPLSDWLPNSAWNSVMALSSIRAFAELPSDMEQSPSRFKEWCDVDTPEDERLPLEWKSLNSFQKLLVIRCLRPDRLTAAITKFVGEKLGPQFIAPSPTFNIQQGVEDTTPTTPIFFLLSPGVDAFKPVAAAAAKAGYTAENNKWVSIAMGGGQETAASRAIDQCSREGGWVFLANVELVPSWLGSLDNLLTRMKDSAHPDFRLFLSGSPSPSIPTSILQMSFKVTLEAPQGLRANWATAWSNFDEDLINQSSKSLEFRTIVFALCWFHAIAVERKKFGFQGWNKQYPFNYGDLVDSSRVIGQYLESARTVPWEDIRFMVADIIYGGHISDDFDRRLCRTYVNQFLREELMDGIELCPEFMSPTNVSHDRYVSYVEQNMPSEGPVSFGLPSNADMNYRTKQADDLFTAIGMLLPRSGAGGGATLNEKAKEVLDDITERLPMDFDLSEMLEKADTSEPDPFFNVFLQECAHANRLLSEIRRSLEELDRGLSGDISLTDSMQEVLTALHSDKVPPSWVAVSYPSRKPLASWFNNFLDRIQQLQQWSIDLQVPPSTWIGGLFNPQAFLTAVMQTSARKNNWSLDNLIIHTEVTKKQAKDIELASREGTYVHGLFLEGTGWDASTGQLGESRSKELHPELPVILIKAIPQERADLRDTYECPVYATEERGSTYIFTANLPTSLPQEKWILEGVCLLFDVTEK